MATDLEKLVVQLSADVKSYERGLVRARGVTNREFTGIERRAKTLNTNLNNMGKGFGRGLIAPLAGVGAALGVAEIIKYADAWKRAGNALKVSGVPAEQLAGTLDRLFDIAQGAGADLGSTVTLFSRLSQSANELGANQEQLFHFTKGVGDALKVAGTDAASASGALLQLSQALGGGIVRAEEFNSINEGARPILQAVADGLDEAGGSVSKLRDIVLAGNLTSKAFFEGFLKGSKGLAAQAQAASTTFGQAFQKIENAFTKYIGQTDESLGASQRLIAGLELLADNFDSTADYAIAFASILAAGLLGRAIGGMVAKIGLGVGALKALYDAFKLVATVGRTAGFMTSLGAAAGPIGAAIGLAAGAAIYFATSADDAAESTESAADMAERYAAALARVKGEAKGAGEESKKSGAQFKETETLRLTKQLENDTKQYAAAAEDVRDAAQRALDRLNDVKDIYGGDPAFQQQVKDLETVRDKLDGTVEGSSQAQEALSRLALDDPGFSTLADRLNPLLDKLIGISQVIKETRDDLKSLGDMEVGTRFMPREGAQEETRRRSTAKYLEERELLELRTAREKEIAELTEKIMKDAKEAGEAITEAEAAASARRTLENRAAAETRSASTGTAFDLIAGYESFREKAYPDYTMRNGKRVNSGYRVGYGSDTVTLDDGSIRKVTEGMTTTLAAATRDLNRRIETEFQPGVRRDIGAERFASFNADQQAVLTSIAYNYGSLPDRIIKAIKEGTTEDVYNAIRNLGGDNSGVNRPRRNKEAEIFLSGAPEGIREDITLRREQNQLIKDKVAAIAEETAGIAADTTMMSASNAERERERVIRETLNELQREGIVITDEVRAAVEAEANARFNAVTAYDATAAAADRLKQKQEELKALNQEISGAFQGAMKGFVKDLVDGKTATEALSNAVSGLADRLLDIALDQIFKSLFSGGASGTGFSLFNFFGGAFSEGGFTGRGGKYQPKGTVHGGEFVFSKKATNRIGIGNLDAMHKAAKRGYAEGGYTLPRISTATGRQQAASVAPQVDARTTVINRFDAASFLSEAMAQPGGAKTILNVIKSQPAAFRAAMQG